MNRLQTRRPTILGFVAIAVHFCVSPVRVDASLSRFLNSPANDEHDKQHNNKQDNSPESSPASYGVDVSFPIHRAQVSTNYQWLPHNMHGGKIPSQYKDMPVQSLGDRASIYKNMIDGCRKHYKGRERLCDSTEEDRIAMNLRQPQSMQNYTALGFHKIKAPEQLFRTIKDFWDRNRHTKMPERWNAGNTYTNHWDVMTYMVSVEDAGLRGGGSRLKQLIWDAARNAIEEWTGQELTECSLYGVRIYENGAVLAPHVDRLPLVSSAIINVAQDVDEPWPIEVYGHDGKAHNVTMEPGDMVLYESHSVVHGRPFPLKGRFYANIFIHFEPLGHSLRHNVAASHDADEHVDEKYRKAVEKGQGGHEGSHDGLPPYIRENTPEAANWKQEHPEAWHKHGDETTFETGSTEAHHAAAMGDMDSLLSIAKKQNEILRTADNNGWTPIHEGTRGGHVDVVEFLVSNGANYNERTNEGAGATPLWLARTSHGKRHPVTAFLESLGAADMGPEL